MKRDDGVMPEEYTAPQCQSDSERLQVIRHDIDAIDKALLVLLNQRAGLSLEVGRIKRLGQEGGSAPSVFRPFRERALLDSLVDANTGPLPAEHIQAIWREILSSSRSLQRPQRIAYLGPEGTFSYFAGLELFGQSMEYQAQGSLEGVFRAVHDRQCELGVVPLENSLQGSVGQSFDLFLHHDVYIQSEMFCRISHSLLSKEQSCATVHTVYSHPQPLAQCGTWLRAHLPNARIIPTESTAAAAHRAACEEGSAAIGHHSLTALLGLNSLASGIEDQPDNWTRFVVIAAQSAEQQGRDKTSMLFSLPDRSGSLADVLNLLATAGINMKKLESRPMRDGKWRYVFFVDVECDLDSTGYAELLDSLRAVCHSLRVLGSYPSGSYFAMQNDILGERI